MKLSTSLSSPNGYVYLQRQNPTVLNAPAVAALQTIPGYSTTATVLTNIREIITKQNINH